MMATLPRASYWQSKGHSSLLHPCVCEASPVQFTTPSPLAATAMKRLRFWTPPASKHPCSECSNLNYLPCAFLAISKTATIHPAWATLGTSTPCTPVGPLAICTYVAAFLHRSRAQADSGCSSIGHYRTNMYIVSWGVKFSSLSLVAAFVFRPFTT